MKKYDTDKLISELNSTHDFYYDYSETEYVNFRTKIKIICPTHGYFYQRIDAHKNGQGCIKCSNEKKVTTKDELIIKMNKIHNNNYSYNLDKYKNSKSIISIFCETHGEFKMTSNYHLSGYGCPSCSGIIKYSEISKDDLSDRLNQIHNNKYQYIDLSIDNIDSYIKVSCPTHGEFKQKIKSHLNGHGV